MWKLSTIFLVVGMLVSGALNTLSKKAANNTSSLDHKFTAPWLQTSAMTLGEFMCLPMYFATRFVRECREGSSLSEEDRKRERAWCALLPCNPFLLLIPACIDVLATSVGGIGLLWVSSSVWQILRGSIVVFVALLSVLFLGRKLKRYHWLGVSVVCCGLVLVGVAAVLGPGGSQSAADPTLVAVGVACILFAQLLASSQMVVEEYLLKGRDLSPWYVVGMEGFFGSVVCIGVVLPIVTSIPGKDHGSYENDLFALKQIRASGSLVAFLVTYGVSIFFYNFTGLSVAKTLSSVHRSLIDALRTTLVWVVNLFIFYVIDKPSFGEKFVVPYSFIQLCGFLFLLCGTFIYNNVVTIPVPWCQRSLFGSCSCFGDKNNDDNITAGDNEISEALLPHEEAE